MAVVIDSIEQAVNHTPSNALAENEIENELNKFYSLCSILHNKRLNAVAIFSLLIKNPFYKKIFMRIIDTDDEREALLVFLQHNPAVCRSKIIRELIED